MTSTPKRHRVMSASGSTSGKTSADLPSFPSDREVNKEPKSPGDGIYARMIRSDPHKGRTPTSSYPTRSLGRSATRRRGLRILRPGGGTHQRPDGPLRGSHPTRSLSPMKMPRYRIASDLVRPQGRCRPLRHIYARRRRRRRCSTQRSDIICSRNDYEGRSESGPPRAS